MSADGTSAGARLSLEHQAALIATDPETFSIADYTGRYGGTDINLSRVDPAEAREIIEESWRKIAPKRLVLAYDRGSG
jgi:hypothetical protein